MFGRIYSWFGVETKPYQPKTTMKSRVLQSRDVPNVLAEARGIVFNGGGVLGIGHVGALSRFNELGVYKQFSYFSGASVGSLLSACMANGAEFDYLNNIVRKMDFNQFLDETKYDLDIVDFVRLGTKFGWYKGHALHDFYRSIMDDLNGDPEITMQESFEKHDNFLTMTAYRTNDQHTIEINHLTCPNAPVARALRWGSTYPFFFATDEVSEEDWIHYTAGQSHPGTDIVFADGGILNNYPVNLLHKQIPGEKIIGLHLTGEKEMEPPIDPHGTLPPPPSNVIRYGMNMGTAIFDQARRVHVEDSDWDRTIKINTGTISSMDFKLSDSDKDWLYSNGRLGVDKFIASRASNIASNGI